jgi:hypothetical protein
MTKSFLDTLELGVTDLKTNIAYSASASIARFEQAENKMTPIFFRSSM